jgi:ABC-type dipeptide/oligopeptide/nickel transport system permease component
MNGIWAAVHYSIFEPAHFIMERRMMTNIKVLAEGGRVSKASENLLVALWMATAALMIASVVAVARRESWLRPLTVFASALLILQLLTLAQPSSVFALGLVAMLAVGLWWRPAIGRSSHPASRMTAHDSRSVRAASASQAGPGRSSSEAAHGRRA